MNRTRLSALERLNGSHASPEPDDLYRGQRDWVSRSPSPELGRSGLCALIEAIAGVPAP